MNVGNKAYIGFIVNNDIIMVYSCTVVHAKLWCIWQFCAAKNGKTVKKYQDMGNGRDKVRLDMSEFVPIQELFLKIWKFLPYKENMV